MSMHKHIATFVTYIKQEKILYPLVMGLSVILSLIEIQGSVINRDAIVYLSTAEAFLEHDFADAFQTYKWPGYAILGALLSKATQIPLENCFYIINILLYAIACAAFVRLYDTLTNNKNALPIVALLVLLLPSFNSYREMIIRDVGFWCFSLLALLSFLRFTQTQKKIHSVNWQLAIGIAFLFRSEALAWIIGLPLCLFWIGTHPFSVRMKRWLASISLYAIALIVVAVFLGLNNSAAEVLLHKIPSVSALVNSFNNLQAAQEQMVLHALNDNSAEHAALIFTSGLLAYFIVVVLAASSVIYLILATVAFSKHYTLKPSSANGIVYWALALNLLTLLAFLLAYQFMIERYAVLAALLILLLISQPITLWLAQAWPSLRPWMRYGFVFLAVAMLLDMLISKNPPPTNLKSAGAWLQENTTVDTPVALNDNRLLHYSGRLRQGVTCIIDKDLSVSLKAIDMLKAYPYLVIQTKRKSLQKETLPLTNDQSFEKVTEFNRGQSVIVIYKNSQPSAGPAVDCNPFR
jgi:hypothetical protein